MKIAIVGTGIAGNVAAWRLHKQHQITVFEANDYVGGHSNSVTVRTPRGPLAVDTGFIVYNERNYPHFTRLLRELGVPTQPSEMSFSVRSDKAKIEYNGSSLNTLFAQRRNLVRPRFYRMVTDILRFNREVIGDSQRCAHSTTTGEYLDRNRYSQAFADLYLLPMAAAIWSTRPNAIREMPLAFLVTFFNHHGLLALRDRPQWRVISGGSREYVDRLVAAHRHRIRLGCPVQSIRRYRNGVIVKAANHEALHFDHVFVATHSDQALSLLVDPTDDETAILGAMQYQKNTATLHTDVSLLPRRHRARAAWNYLAPAAGSGGPTVTYSMNRLQNLNCEQQYCVTLNDPGLVADETVLHRTEYDHPLITTDSADAQGRQAELNSARTHYCGAYWKNGFHEDGVVSALAAIGHFEEASQGEQLHLRRAG